MDWSAVDNSPATIREFLEQEGLALKKRWGQNFMVSGAARSLIVTVLAPAGDDVVWEVGPGLGAITSLLVDAAGRVVVFEIDYGIIRVLRERFGAAVSIVAGDAVRTVAEWVPGGELPSPSLVAGNLPYSSAAPIVAALLDSPASAQVRRMVFTVQLEMARRMIAGPGSGDYSPLSVLCSLSGTVRFHREVAAGSFYPRPEVVSAVVSIDPADQPPALRRLASVCARALFSRRRKTLRNNVSVLAEALAAPAGMVHSALASAGISESLRAEALPPEKFREIAGALHELGATLPVATPGSPS